MISSYFFKAKNPTHYLKWTCLSALSGLLAGLAATAFLTLLKIATDTREADHRLIFLLPVGGFIIGWIYHRYGKSAERGHNLILDEIHEPQNTLPVRMAPMVLFGTIVTHLFGGSAGREGTAVQMGASLSDQLSKFFPIEPEERRILLVAGAGAGFGASIGAPWAGVLFGMEVIHVGRLRLFALIECLIASHLSYLVTQWLHAPHTVYPTISTPVHSCASWLSTAVSGIAFGLAAVLFVNSTHLIEKTQKRWVSAPPLRPLLGGLILIPLFLLDGNFRFTGLGIPVIQDALMSPAAFAVPLLKIAFTAITLGSGFKGGEFIPLVFIGTTLGSALSTMLPAEAGLLGALGFAAVFGAASNTPLSCTIMAMEIFGTRIGPFALVCCYLAYYSTFHHRIYASQGFHQPKLRRLRELLFLLGELPARFFDRENKG